MYDKTPLAYAAAAQYPDKPFAVDLLDIKVKGSEFIWNYTMPFDTIWTFWTLVIPVAFEDS